MSSSFYTTDLIWDMRWMKVAETFSSFSKDPSTKVGAVAIRDNVLLSHGWNGFPRGIRDDSRLDTREIKYKYVVHAEMNCIYNASRIGASLTDSTMYVYGLPVCSSCCLGVIQSGVKRVVMKYPKINNEAWLTSFEHTIEVFKEAGIEFESMR